MKVLRAMEGPDVSLQGMRRGKLGAEPQGVAEQRLSLGTVQPSHLKLFFLGDSPQKLLTTPVSLVSSLLSPSHSMP